MGILSRSKKAIVVRLLVLAGLVMVGASEPVRHAAYRWYHSPSESTNIKHHARFAAAVEDAGQFRLYVGLPHHRWERDLRASETAEKKVVVRRGEYFYEEPVAVAMLDREALKALAIDRGNFLPWTGHKLCGGYHPDYLLEWTDADGRVHELHLCFGCHEAKFYGPRYSLYCDVSELPLRAIGKILWTYRGERRPTPATK